MISCKCCGAPTPPPELRVPVGTQYIDDVGRRPVLIFWNCPGELEIDLDLLRWFGVIARQTHTCRMTRGTWWTDAPQELRRRSLEADVLRLTLGGLI